MVVFGKQIIHYLLERHPEKIRAFHLAKEVEPAYFARMQGAGAKIFRVDVKKAQAMARGGNHQGVLAEIEPPVPAGPEMLKNARFAVMTVGVTDVGNLGAIGRTAFALGVEVLIVSGIQSLAWEGAIRTSSGALLDLPVILEPNPMDGLNHLKMAGFTCYGATLEGEDRREFPGAGKRALILGSEHEGIPAKLRRRLDKEVTIPMRREFDSLNVGAAAAILIDRMRG